MTAFFAWVLAAGTSPVALYRVSMTMGVAVALRSVARLLFNVPIRALAASS